MSPLLLDTNAYVAFKRGRPEALTILQRASTISVNSVLLGELLSGFAAGARREINRKELGAFLASPRVTVLPVELRTAEQYASIYLALRNAGTAIPTNDMWIAATAMQHGLALFSYDKHFHAIEGLQVGMSVSELEGAQ